MEDSNRLEELEIDGFYKLFLTEDFDDEWRVKSYNTLYRPGGKKQRRWSGRLRVLLFFSTTFYAYVIM